MTGFKNVVHENKVIGKEFLDERVHAFFGNRHGTIEHLKALYPAYEFLSVKQVHGIACVESPAAENTEADAHWTDQPGRALVVYTADCLPVLIEEKNGMKILSIHAGWRGIAAEIIPAALNGFAPERAFIGPHIRTPSFEVGLDVAERLQKTGGAEVIHPHSDPQKKYADLTSIALTQLRRSGLPAARVAIDPVDTFADASYVSFRKLGKGCGRLLSFIARPPVSTR